MAPPLAIYSPYSVQGEPTAIRKYFDALMNRNQDPLYKSKWDEREGFVHTVVESGATGAALGAAHAMLPTGLDVGKAPIDGIAGVLGALVASRIRGKVGRSLNAISGHALSVYAFRSTAKLINAKATMRGEGEFAADPLEEAAKDL